MDGLLEGGGGCGGGVGRAGSGGAGSSWERDVIEQDRLLYVAEK